MVPVILSDLVADPVIVAPPVAVAATVPSVVVIVAVSLPALASGSPIDRPRMRVAVAVRAVCAPGTTALGASLAPVADTTTFWLKLPPLPSLTCTAKVNVATWPAPR